MDMAGKGILPKGLNAQAKPKFSPTGFDAVKDSKV